MLVVDDDAMTRMLVLEALEPEGFRVVEASSGADGIVQFAQVAPDVVLLDVSMPGIDGFECCTRIRQLPNGARVPIVVITGNDDDESIARAFDVGATDFVSKPMRWQLLAHRVRYLLRASDALEKISRSEASLAYAQHLAQVGSWEFRPVAASDYWSDEMFRILGLAKGRDQPCFESILQAMPAAERPPLAQAFLNLRTEGVRYELEHIVLLPNGEQRTVLHQAEAVHENGGAPLLQGTLQDITERKAHEARIEYLANHDALTDLPNRNLLDDRVAQSIAQAKRAARSLSIMLLDLDRFKYVNDTFGHAVGDGLLQEVARRLKAATREEDTVARLGGDEFVLMLPDIEVAEDAEAVACKVVEAFSRPFIVEDHELHVTTSLGISLFPKDANSGEMLLKMADAALYCAKDKGRNCYQFYTQEMGLQVEEQTELEHALHQAIVRRELELHYQPKVDLQTGAIVGVEALVRWRRPEIGLIAPTRFIPLAEETGLIIPIGEWVLREACTQTVRWHNDGYAAVTVAVNVSARQFRQQNFPEVVRNVLSETGLPPEFLELELTESVVVQDRDNTLAALKQLKEIGVALSLDDFGTGYSSLSYLKDFPIDAVKIDRSFVNDVTNSVDGASLAKSIISMAESLRMKTIAEGVETAGQLAFLQSNRCDVIQGFYFSRPLPEGDISDMLARGQHLPTPERTTDESSRTLLLVDDDAEVLAALQRVLRRDGYRILSTTSPAEALEIMAMHKVSVIVSDAVMPELQGTELLGRVKGLYPDTVRIMLSGCSEIRSITEAINEGAVYKFLTKPWDNTVLRDHVAEAFRRYDLAKENRAR